MVGITYCEMKRVKSHFGEKAVDHFSSTWLRDGAPRDVVIGSAVLPTFTVDH